MSSAQPRSPRVEHIPAGPGRASQTVVSGAEGLEELLEALGISLESFSSPEPDPAPDGTHPLDVPYQDPKTKRTEAIPATARRRRLRIVRAATRRPSSRHARRLSALWRLFHALLRPHCRGALLPPGPSRAAPRIAAALARRRELVRVATTAHRVQRPSPGERVSLVISPTP